MTELQKLPQESKDMTADNIEKLSSIFPNCITEVKDKDGNVKKSVNFDVLKQMMSSNLIEGSERYEFTWPGKNAAILEANTPIRKTLRPCVEESKDWENTQNLYIEGDNLDALKLLQESYLGKIKMIYIDPPYNTGNDFIYKDNFHQSEDDYDEKSGSINEDGYRMYKNSDSFGRFHSNWCSMIYPRLLLARNLLSEDGVIFISIDDNEQENLKEICNEIFGQNNFVTQIVWEKVHTRKNSALYFSSSHEYILVYAKIKRQDSKDNVGFKRNLLPRDNTDAYSNPDNDPKGPWKADPITAHNYYAADYSITKPNGVVINRPKDRYWAYSEASIKQMIENNSIIWGDGDRMPMAKRYLCDVQEGLVPTTLFLRTFAGDSSSAKKQLDNLFPEVKGIFDYSKPVSLIEKLLQIGSDKNDIILDFFSGSSTTANAILSMNATDNGHRKFIMVQVPEVNLSTSEQYKNGFKTICDIGKERIRRAGAAINEKNSSKKIDIGFRVLKIDDSNMKDVYYNPEALTQDLLLSLESNIKDDRTDLDLLFSTLLDFGLTLDKQIKEEVIDGKKILIYNDDAEEGADLIACFEDNISEELIKEIAKRKPSKAVFKDSSFANSPVKINLFELFKLYAEIDADELPFRVKVI